MPYQSTVNICLRMNRKKFISTTALLGSGFFSLPINAVANEDIVEKSVIIPPYLKAGDTIALTSPAGYITAEEVQPAIQQIESWGLKVQLGTTIGKRDGTFGGTDEERTNDFQQLLNDENIKAIMCARGGYGFVRIIDNIDFTHLRKQPKWLIGFSDITVLHSHINKNIGVATIHSKMCNSFPDDWSKAEPAQVETILSIKKALMGERMEYATAFNSNNRAGKSSGILVGGNLKTIESLAASKSDITTDGKILFVEDTGEYLYSIDRMFWNLKRSKKLEKLAGLIIGGFKIKPSETPEEEFGKNLFEIVHEKIKDYSYPVCFDFPVGHQKNNFALKCGVKHLLDVNATQTILKEQ